MRFAVKNEAGAIVGFTEGENHEDAFYNFNNGDLLCSDDIFTFEELSPVQVEEGKYYLTRNLAVCGPMIRNLSRLYDEEWKWTFKGWGAGEVWRDDGTFGQRTEYDLMCEYIS